MGAVGEFFSLLLGGCLLPHTASKLSRKEYTAMKEDKENLIVSIFKQLSKIAIPVLTIGKLVKDLFKKG